MTTTAEIPNIDHIIEYLPVGALIPDKNNSKIHSEGQIKQIESSILEFGFTAPILIRGNNMIIAGHGRQIAARNVGMTKVPCIRLDHLTETQAKALVIADNKLTENGGWDNDLLKKQIDSLENDDFDVSILGFNDEELSDLTASLDPDEPQPDPEPQIDRAEELREKWGVESGQVWTLGKHRLMCGDSTSEDCVRCLLNKNKPEIMVTDPPYGVKYDADWRNRADRANGKPYRGRAIGKVTNDNCSDWLDAYMLFKGNVAYIWHPVGALQGIFLDSINRAGFDVRTTIIWAKNNFPIGRGHYHIKHEPCFYAVRHGKTALWGGDRKQHTLWEINKPQKSESGHSTQKPLECMARPIRNHTCTSVYDPFVGSGTTIIACEHLQRYCFAMEISPAYTAVAIQRWVDLTGETPILAQD